MTIGFKQIPSTLRTSGFFAEVDPSHANTATVDYKSLLIGQLISAGSADRSQRCLQTLPVSLGLWNRLNPTCLVRFSTTI